MYRAGYNKFTVFEPTNTNILIPTSLQSDRDISNLEFFNLTEFIV